MKRILSFLYTAFLSLAVMACSSEVTEAPASGENGNGSQQAAEGTLVVYYSFTGNSQQIVETLTSQITADVLRIEPATKDLDYAANNYALGSQLLNAINANPDAESSYPAIDAVDVDLSKYADVIIVTPLWWSQMAAPMQTFLFKYGSQLAGKNLGLIVSSHSSSISGVESDCKRLVPTTTCSYFSQSLWINNANHARRASLISQWLTDIGYVSSSTVTSGTMNITIKGTTKVCTLVDNSSTRALLEQLSKGDITYEAHDYGDFEKVGNTGYSFPQNNEDINTVPGDVILYEGENICLYYDANSWSFTRLGKIEGITQSEMKSFVHAGEGNVTVTLSLPSTGNMTAVRANAPSSETQIYSTTGQPLSSAPSKGIYIENGAKKVR